MSLPPRTGIEPIYTDFQSVALPLSYPGYMQKELNLRPTD